MKPGGYRRRVKRAVVLQWLAALMGIEHMVITHQWVGRTTNVPDEGVGA